MSIYEVGRLAVKIAGRDAGKTCVVVEKVDNNFVLIDGSTRRKKVNVKHLEPLDKVVELKDKASHEEVKKVFEELKLPVWDKKSKKVAARPRKQRKVKEKKEESKVKEVPKKEQETEAKPKAESKKE